MIKVSNIETFGWMGAIRGMRNSWNSWEKSDSESEGGEISIGPNDLRLMQKLYNGGPSHRKFLRMIHVQMDVIGPSYWISELDTYKIGVTRNSCSFMHKGISEPFTINDFTVGDERVYEIIHKHNNGASPKELSKIYSLTPTQIDNIIWQEKTNNQDLFMLAYSWDMLIAKLNYFRDLYLDTKDNKYFEAIRALVPMGYNYRFTIDMNYENVFTIIQQRSGHKLDEWREFCKILKQLPYVEEIGGFYDAREDKE